MFDYHKFFNRILLISGLGFILFTLIQLPDESLSDIRMFVGGFNILVYLLRTRLDKEVARNLLILELYIFTPYLFYQNFVIRQDAHYMIFSTIMFFSGSFLFHKSKSNLIYLCFNGLNLFLYLVVSFFSKESIVVAFIFLCMYIFTYNIHRAFLSSLATLTTKEKNLKDCFYWMTNSIDSPLAKVNNLMEIFEIHESVETTKIQKQIREIKKELNELEQEFQG